MTDIERWEKHGIDHGWKMPSAPLWKRLPIIRHVRATWNAMRVEAHNDTWRRLGSIPTGYDNWVVFGIWIGRERAN